MRRSLLLAVFLVGCTQPANLVPKSSGSLALSADDSTLYVADKDHDRITVIDTGSREVLRHVTVGESPERVVVAPDGAVLVTLRGQREVVRLAPGSLAVEVRGAVGAEPVGLALSPDGQKVLVANTMSGTVSVLDAKTLGKVDEFPVGGQPYAVVPLADGRRAYVTDFSSGTVNVVDLTDRRTVSTTALEQPPEAECQWAVPPSRTPAQPADVIVSPDGERAYVAHVQSRTVPDPFTNSLSFAVAPALSTLNTSDDRLNRETTAGARADFPAALLATNLDESCQMIRSTTTMDAPSSLVVDGSGDWIFVADHNSNAVAVVSAYRARSDRMRVPERGIYDVVRVGARPTGIAVTSDLKTAWVHNALDYSVSLVENNGGQLAQTQVIHFASSDLPPAIERGRRLFYSAVDPRMTEPELGGVSCSSCHPDGRTDGLSWSLPESSMIPADARNTPALWGVAATAPYHWDGMLQSLPAFSMLMVQQMGGDGLRTDEIADLTAYMETITPPDNPNLPSPAVLARGAELFEGRCSSCHAGEQLTDGQTWAGVNTPSLRGVFATAPYLHNGSVPTLQTLFEGSSSTIQQHHAGDLPREDLQALEQFVRSL